MPTAQRNGRGPEPVILDSDPFVQGAALWAQSPGHLFALLPGIVRAHDMVSTQVLHAGVSI